MAETTSRLMYTKEYILQFAHINKDEPTIVKLLTPFTSPQKPHKKPSLTPGATPVSRNRKKSWNNTEISTDSQKLQVPQTEPRMSKNPVIKNQNQMKENIPSNLSTISKNIQPLSPSKSNLLVVSPPSTPRLKPPTANTHLKISPISPAKPGLTPPSTPQLKNLPKSPRNSNYLLPPSHTSHPSNVDLNQNGVMLSVSTPQKSPRITQADITVQSATPPTSPRSMASTAVSPLRSPRSPARPISPLDDQRLLQRQKQIDYGYRTIGYLRYRLLVPKDQRKPDFPRTPKKIQGCSKRSWDGQLKKWRRDLHLWDPESIDTFRAVLESDLVKNIILSNPELEEIVRIVKDKIDNPSLHQNDDGDDEYSTLESEIGPMPSRESSSVTLPVIVENPTTTPPSNSDISLIKNDISSKKKVSPSRIDDPRITKVARTLIF